jgi:kynurenine 3-monooxygenase
LATVARNSISKVLSIFGRRCPGIGQYYLVEIFAEMTKKEKKAAIVGGGLVGSLWAVMLAKRGYEVDVYERRPDMRRAGYSGGRSINLAMSERGWKGLRSAGIADQLRHVAIPMRGRMIHNLGGSLTYQPYGTETQAIYSVSRGGLNLALINIASQMPNVRFHFNMRCRGLDLDQISLGFEDMHLGEKFSVAPPLIFATDGAFSAVRSSLQKTNRFNYSQTYLDYAYKELSIPPTADGSHRMEVNALHIWPRGNFMLIALPNVDGTFTCTLFLPFEGADSFENLRTDLQVMDFFMTYFPDAVPLMPTLLENFSANATSSLVTVRCSPWLYQNRVLLLGDAAHAIVPFFGQGMNAGFEDCTILDDLLSQHGEDWDTVLPLFNAQRIRDGNAIADLALRNFVEMRDLVADPRFILRKKIAAWLHGKYPDFLPVYSMVSFSHLPYSTALRESDAQDALFDRILALEGVEQHWNGPAVEQVFLDWWKLKKTEYQAFDTV